MNNAAKNQYVEGNTTTGIELIKNQFGINYNYLVEKFKVTPEMRNEVGGIQNFNKFLHEYRAKSPRRNGEFDNRYKNYYELLINIQKYINNIYCGNNDPIEYLIFLYSKHGPNGLPINEIEKRLGYLWKNTNGDTFRKLFVDILQWTLRDVNDRTDFSKRKNKRLRVNEGIKRKRSGILIQESTEKFNKKFKEILESKNNNNGLNNKFNYQEFEKLETKQSKIIYIFAYLLRVTEDEAIKNIISLKNSGISLNIIANGIQKFIDDNGIDENGKKLPKLFINRDNIKSIIRRYDSNKVKNANNKKKYEILNEFILKKANTILQDDNKSYDKIDFNFDIYNNLNKNQKILYLLNFLYGIEKRDLIELNKKGIGSKILAKHLNKILKLLLTELKIKLIITSSDIHNIFREDKKRGKKTTIPFEETLDGLLS